MGSGSRELLARREDVWAFLAEPYHLSDWWPGVVGVVPDRRGFAPDARWRVDVLVGLGGAVGPAIVGRRSQPKAHTLVITAVEPYERWSWELIGSGGSRWRARSSKVEIRLRTVAADRTSVTVGIEAPLRWLSGGSEARVARTAVNRLYDLVQTAATL